LKLRRLAWKLAVILFAAAMAAGYLWVRYGMA
jgi:hypothetical protein